jgi:hypothetical protein
MDDQRAAIRIEKVRKLEAGGLEHSRRFPIRVHKQIRQVGHMVGMCLVGGVEVAPSGGKGRLALAHRMNVETMKAGR